MIPQDGPAVEILEVICRGFLGGIPIAIRVVGPKLVGLWPGKEANERATETLYHQEALVRRVIETVTGTEEGAGLPASARGTRFAVGSLYQIACSINSLSEIR